ncbi:DUF6001 family protein [Streptomyces sp. TG1A-60]|uniref:DUF6001 family protein n=1 Tax=Streptomyces sp. TG1A-60 TaxID=3129111 RepID=UPI0030CB1C90
MTVYWVVWDAGAHWVVDRLEREGALPAVTRIRERGVFGAARPARPNCQTPPSLATLFTGTWPAEHQVTGFTVPGAGQGVASQVSGFAPGFPATPPVWEAMSENDLTSALVHVPWVFGADGRVGPHVDGAVEAYSGRRTRHALHMLEPGAGLQHWDIGAYRVDAAVERSPDGSERVRVDAGEHLLLSPDGGWQPFGLDRYHGTWMRCVRVAERLMLVHTGVWRARTAGRNPKMLHRLAQCPPFAGEGVGPLYRRAAFGPRLAEGGDGSAEEVFLSSVECVARSFGAATDAVLETHDADLVVVYLPMTDDVGHEFLGWCDERSAAYRPDMSARVWSYIRRCYTWSDAILGRVLDRAGAEDTVVLGADHGMVGSTHLVYLNDQLVRAGLAARDADGALDPAGSQVFYHPANNGSLWVAEGAADDPVRVRQVMSRARAVLSSITDPETGRPVVAGFLDRDGEPLAGAQADAGVAYVALADDYQPSAQLLGEGPTVRRVAKTGAHVVNTGDSRLHAVHAAVGPGIGSGTAAGSVDNTLPAALVLGQLGLGPGPAALYRNGPLEPTDEKMMDMPSGFPHGLSPDKLTARRHAQVTAFLGSRDLDPVWLSELMRERVGAGLLLLTSSPVHGLANPTSDLDFIRIQEAAIDGPRISTKIFENGHHLEVVSFSEAELASNLDELDRLADLPAERTVAGFRAWDKQREPRRKQTERIVNGITMDGSAPYLGWLPSLSRVWSRAALHTAIEQVVHTTLAETAGETRGRVGYAYNVLLHLMDGLLSHHGDVYTTRKWYVLRWTRLMTEGGWHDESLRTVAVGLERLRKDVHTLLGPALAGEPVAAPYAELALEAVRATGTARAVTVEVEITGRVRAFLPGAAAVLGADSGVVLPGVGTESDLPFTRGPVGLDELSALDAPAAASLLRALRAGVARLRIGYQGRDAGR